MRCLFFSPRKNVGVFISSLGRVKRRERCVCCWGGGSEQHCDVVWKYVFRRTVSERRDDDEGRKWPWTAMTGLAALT